MKIRRVIEINNDEDWFKEFQPAGGKKQWKSGYSAKEFAKVVTADSFEEEIGSSLGFDKKHFRLFQEKMYPEQLTRFDDDWHGPRHHDLACLAKINDKDTALCFEAKVREPLDTKLSIYDKASKNKKIRIENLCKIFFGDNNIDKYKNIYYQILTGLAGSVAFAAQNNAKDCYFIIYQLIQDNESKGDKEKKKQIEECKKEHINALNDFLNFFNGGAVKERFQEIDTKKVIDLGNIRMKLKDSVLEANTQLVYIEKHFFAK